MELTLAGRVVATVVVTVVVLSGMERQEHAFETWDAPKAERYLGSGAAVRFSLAAEAV